jgi:hypothetical protein
MTTRELALSVVCADGDDVASVKVAAQTHTNVEFTPLGSVYRAPNGVEIVSAVGPGLSIIDDHPVLYVQGLCRDASSIRVPREYIDDIMDAVCWYNFEYSEVAQEYVADKFERTAEGDTYFDGRQIVVADSDTAGLRCLILRKRIKQDDIDSMLADVESIKGMLNELGFVIGSEPHAVLYGVNKLIEELHDVREQYGVEVEAWNKLRTGVAKACFLLGTFSGRNGVYPLITQAVQELHEAST